MLHWVAWQELLLQLRKIIEKDATPRLRSARAPFRSGVRFQCRTCCREPLAHRPVMNESSNRSTSTHVWFHSLRPARRSDVPPLLVHASRMRPHRLLLMHAILCGWSTLAASPSLGNGFSSEEAKALIQIFSWQVLRHSKYILGAPSFAAPPFSLSFALSLSHSLVAGGGPAR